LRIDAVKAIAERRAPQMYRMARRLYHTPPQVWRKSLSCVLPSEEQMLEFVDGLADQIFFVQIGAHDGKTGDHLRPFVLERGWKGVMVEPVMASFQKLVDNYAGLPGLSFVRAAVADRDGEIEFWRCIEDAPVWMSLLASLRREVVE
jgi:hypothetical protein